MKEHFQSLSFIRSLISQMNKKDRQWLEQYYHNPNQEISLNLGIPLLFGKDKGLNIVIYACALIAALSMLGAPHQTSVTPETTATSSPPTTAQQLNRLYTDQSGKQWECQFIPQQAPNAFRAVLQAGDPKKVEQGPYLVVHFKGDTEQVSDLPQVVHNGDRVCIKK